MQYYSLQAKRSEPTHYVAWIEVVLGEYDSVFQELQGLPPNRRHNHAIRLKKASHSLHQIV